MSLNKNLKDCVLLILAEKNGQYVAGALNFIGSEFISVLNIENGINPSDSVKLEIKYLSGDIKTIDTLCRIDTKNELEYYKNGGILQYVLRNMI